MESERVSLPLIHEHLMMPWNDFRKGDCCGRFESISDGYYCESCDFFVHKKCSDEITESIQHPSHSLHPLCLRSDPHHNCNLCGRRIVNLYYRCQICDFDVDLHCVKYPPPEVTDVSDTHHHKLTLLKELTDFDCCAKCGETGDNEFAYECHVCELTFHVDCVWNQPEVEHPLEVNHSYHSLHPLKLLTGQPPEYSDGKCRLCGRNVGKLFYHCSSCNFTLDMHCTLDPPPQSLMDLKAHDHQLILRPRLDSFTCNACGLKGDRSPYACFQCGFMIHQDCFGLPRVININRHDHRVYRTSVLGVLNSVCGVCRKKVDWTCGGYTCQRCPGYVVHSKCATREDVWNGKELEGVPEEIQDNEPYVAIDENTIQHFSHKEHYLRLHVHRLLWEENKHCNACSYPICLQSFYACIDCDFVLHQNCAELPKRKWHLLYGEQLTLVTTSKAGYFDCDACGKTCNGFAYQHGATKIDFICASISEPFIHPSHPYHPLYYIPQDKEEICNGCNMKESHVLRCTEDGCEFVLGFRCATLPQVVKLDNDLLSLWYGNEMTSGKYWCDICEKELNPETWFYKDRLATAHIECVVGDFLGLVPRSTILYRGKSFEVVLNNNICRPFCRWCKSRCIYPIILKLLRTSDTCFCSDKCICEDLSLKPED
ncbi:hypothetical protein AALP_AAs63807U000300 [Arabis alpina]|uniref:Zinc finger PHD-type domain-containing protein n=1 Tax=Arabis alpina TaxID=50452 RepID=A0A087G1D0_ARAAL|nr:hypothetical protein AALP_AAs63807U000300 [Arabis alpina]